VDAEETWRLFFAVEMPEEVRAEVAEALGELASAARIVVKWVEAENLHITLKFVGAVPQARVTEVRELGREAARAGSCCTLRIVGAGAFPNARRPRVVWLGTTGDFKPLASVATELDRLAAGRGLAEAENRPFTAHLTLGRVRRGKLAPDLTSLLEGYAGREFGEARVDGFVLMRSHLRHQGPIYEVVESYALPGGSREAHGE